MFGNLSKTLIKAPHYFNNNQTYYSMASRFTEGNRPQLLDTFSSLSKKSNSKSDRNYSLYFKERDYLRKNLRLDLNYNNNLRKEISPNVKTAPSISFEDLIHGNNKLCSNLTTANNTLISNNNNSSKVKINKMDRYKDFLNKTLISQDSIRDYKSTVNSNVNHLIDKVNYFSPLNYVYNKFSKKYEKEKIDLSILRHKINDNRYFSPPIKYKFPPCRDNRESLDSLYRETMDRKLISLKSLSPHHKESLKNKNRNYVSKIEYIRYTNNFKSHDKNPFSETTKYYENKGRYSFRGKS